MKEVWICRWEIAPGDGEHTERFSSLSAAKRAMRQKISKCVDLCEYLADLDAVAADFLGKYLSDPQFPGCKADVPEDYQEPEHGELILDAGFICWDHPYDAYLRLNTNLVLENISDEDYTFDFWYEHPEELTDNRITGLSIRISPRIDYGTSAYPLMILRVLNSTPKSQEQIIRDVFERYDTKMDRKAVGRHLKLLQALGFTVEHNQEGYYLLQEK